MKKQNSFYPKEGQVDQKWYQIDATDQVLGRLATQVATIIRGKNKPTFTPSVDTGDFVVIVNADKIKLTGNKLRDKKYYRHSNYPGGLKVKSAQQILDTHPERLLLFAIRGMLPHNRLSRKLITKVKIYAGTEHPHTAQQPIVLTSNS